MNMLQLICLRRVSFARRALSSYLSSSSPSLSPPYKGSDLPLAHFSWLLLRIVPTRKVQYYGALIAKFKSSLGSDETIMAYLDQIGQLYFGVAPKGAGGGMFGNLLKGLMGGQQEEKKNLPSSDDEGEEPKDPELSLFQSELAALLRGDAPVVTQVDDDLD